MDSLCQKLVAVYLISILFLPFIYLFLFRVVINSTKTPPLWEYEQYTMSFLKASEMKVQTVG